MRTARSFSSAGYRFWDPSPLAMLHPHFQGVEPPGFPGRFTDRGQMNWDRGKTSAWPTFGDIHCELLTTGHLRADVSCTFRESAEPDVGNPVAFWGIALVHAGTRWLIASYGQG
jgi:hypothetical protein